MVKIAYYVVLVPSEEEEAQITECTTTGLYLWCSAAAAVSLQPCRAGCVLMSTTAGLLLCVIPTYKHPTIKTV